MNKKNEIINIFLHVISLSTINMISRSFVNYKDAPVIALVIWHNESVLGGVQTSPQESHKPSS